MITFGLSLWAEKAWSGFKSDLKKLEQKSHRRKSFWNILCYFFRDIFLLFSDEFSFDQNFIYSHLGSKFGQNIFMIILQSLIYQMHEVNNKNM